MFYILCGTNRPGSRSLEICNLVKPLYEKNFKNVEIINLENLELNKLTNESYGEGHKPAAVTDAINKLNKAEGLLVVCPEYNGSMPGALKYFIDFWSYPKTFEYRPVGFIGLGGAFGGLRPVEHLQQVFGYRNAFMLPNRVFIQNVWNILKNGKIIDETTNKLIHEQADKFYKFVCGLNQQKLSANTFED